MPAAARDVETACRAGDCETAIGLMEDAVARQPHDFRLPYRLGICYGGSCRPHRLVDSAMAVAYLSHASGLTAHLQGADRAAVMDELANALCRPSTSSPEALRKAIACYREAAEIYWSLGRPGDWARIEYNLGNCACDLSDLTGEDHWAEAVEHYQQSLSERRRSRDPERVSALLENLGTAFRRLTAGDAGENVRKAIGCYHGALRICPLGEASRRAALENNLGNAFLSLPEADEKLRKRHAQRALRHFDRALGMQPGGRSSRGYGITLFNRAQAFRRLDRRESAVACLEEAAAVFQTCGDERRAQMAQSAARALFLEPHQAAPR